MKIIVTGSSGCVGRETNYIGPHDWVFLDRRDCDLTDRDAVRKCFEKFKPHAIIHLAAYVPGFYNIDRVASFSNNVRINENVLEACHQIGVQKGLFCLSSNMFPDNPVKFPIDESMIFDGTINGVFAGYAYSKRMLALQCENYNTQYGRNYFTIIPTNVYGPNDNFTSGRLIPNLIMKFKDAQKKNEDVVINGTGKPLRQFIYSVDLAKIIQHLIINYHENKPIICCDDAEISIKDLTFEIAKVMNFKNKIHFDDSKPDGIIKKTADNSYFKTLMSDFKFTSLNEGLTQIIKELERRR